MFKNEQNKNSNRLSGSKLFFFFFKYAERVLRIEKNTSVSSQMLPGH